MSAIHVFLQMLANNFNSQTCGVACAQVKVNVSKSWIANAPSSRADEIAGRCGHGTCTTCTYTNVKYMH